VVVRFPSGKSQIATPPANSVVLWKRAKILAEAKIIDRRMGSEVGRLNLFKCLSDKQAAAADRWGEWSGRYDRIKGLPSKTTPSPHYEVGYGRTHEGEPTLRHVDREFLVKFDKAYWAVVEAAGKPGIKVLEDVAVQDRKVENEERLSNLKNALRALVYHWRL
jgi:hypothetical protein